MRRPQFAIILGTAALLGAPQQQAASQWRFLTDHDRPYRAMYVAGTDILPMNTTLTVSGRRDGWVELEFKNVMAGGVHAPWLIAQNETEVNEPRTRGYFTPAEARRAALLADSILAVPQRWDSTTKRWEPPVSRATSLFETPRMAPLEPPLFSWGMIPYQLGHIGRPPTIDFSYCYNGLLDGLQARGGYLSVEQFRALIGSLREAAKFAETFSREPQPLSANLIEARDAACEARPRTHPVPEYHAHAGASSGDVHLDAIVDTSGHIEPDIHVLFASDSIFAADALASLKRWRFAPALFTLGHPVRQRLHVQFHFAPEAPDRDEVKALLIEAGDHGAGILVLAYPPRANQARTALLQ